MWASEVNITKMSNLLQNNETWIVTKYCSFQSLSHSVKLQNKERHGGFSSSFPFIQPSNIIWRQFVTNSSPFIESRPQTILTPFLLHVTSQDNGDSPHWLFTTLTRHIILPARDCHFLRQSLKHSVQIRATLRCFLSRQTKDITFLISSYWGVLKCWLMTKTQQETDVHRKYSK